MVHVHGVSPAMRRVAGNVFSLVLIVDIVLNFLHT